jgi:hypothetical protein
MLGSKIAELTVPSGALASGSLTEPLVVQPVPESALTHSKAQVDSTRWATFGRVLSFKEAVMSPVLHVAAPTKNGNFKFPLLLRLQAVLPNMASSSDLCLAMLDPGTNQWGCSTNGRNLTTDYEAGFYTGGLVMSGTYAIVLMPIKITPIQPPLPATAQSWWASNGVIVTAVTAFTVVFFGAVLYVGGRLLRYRKKYKASRAEKEELDTQIEMMKFEAQTAELDLNVNPSFAENPTSDLTLRELKESKKTLKALRQQFAKEQARTSELETQLAELREYRRRVQIQQQDD